MELKTPCKVRINGGPPQSLPIGIFGPHDHPDWPAKKGDHRTLEALEEYFLERLGAEAEIKTFYCEVEYPYGRGPQCVRVQCRRAWEVMASSGTLAPIVEELT